MIMMAWLLAATTAALQTVVSGHYDHHDFAFTKARKAPRSGDFRFGRTCFGMTLLLKLLEF
jgi:hypothetical protein